MCFAKTLCHSGGRAVILSMAAFSWLLSRSLQAEFTLVSWILLSLCHRCYNKGSGVSFHWVFAPNDFKKRSASIRQIVPFLTTSQRVSLAGDRYRSHGD